MQRIGSSHDSANVRHISRSLLAWAVLGAAINGCSSSSSAPGSPVQDAAPPLELDVTPPENGTATATAYLLFGPTASKTVYLTDLTGRKAKSWTTSRNPGLGLRMTSNGSIVRAEQASTAAFGSSPGGAGGMISLYTWDGTKSWSYNYVGSDYLQHHDIEVLPNGNVIMIAWEKKTSAEAVAAGRKAATVPSSGYVWSEKLVEYNPTTGAIDWEWKAWDHLLASGQSAVDHPELIDPTANAKATDEDWLHINSVRYSASLNQLVLSVHGMNEIWIIDHGTTTAQAASHSGGTQGKGGDILYRWGNPSAWGMTGTQQLYQQHNARWVDSGYPGAGNITIFDNGQSGTRPYSRVVEIATPVTASGAYSRTAGADFSPTAPTWTYEASPNTDFFASQISSAQRVASGNTVIANGPAGTFFEVDTTGAIQWTYQLTTTGTSGVSSFQVERIEKTDSRISSKTITLGAKITLGSN